MNKYLHYLKIKHSWTGINCITLIEDIYLTMLNISLKDSWNRFNLGKQLNSDWAKKYTLDLIEKESKFWKKIPITDLQEFDILFFVSKKNIPLHFGLYIHSNTFIHVEDKSYCTFSELNQYYRDMLYGCYRYVV